MYFVKIFHKVSYSFLSIALSCKHLFNLSKTDDLLFSLIIFLCLIYLFLIISKPFLLVNDNQQGMAVKTIKPKQVIDNVTEVDVALITYYQLFLR